jgi:hypothetical protein
MRKTIKKPRFEEIITPTTMNLPDEGLVFDAQRVGPMNFADLRNADYDEGFIMATMPEIVSLVYASFENQNYDTAKNVIKTLRKGIIGNTGILYVPDGMFVQDNPKLKNREISMNQKTLERRLGSHEERGVVFSDNGKIRFTPYNYIKKTQLSSQLSTNTGIIALVGGKENAEKLSRASGHYRVHPYFDAFENLRFSLDRIACLSSDFFNNRLKINAYWDEGRAYEGYSFGVKKDTEDTPKK